VTRPPQPREPEELGPVEFRDPVVRQELKKASVWIALVLVVVGVIVLAQPLLLIFAGIVLAAMLDGGARLLGRVLPIGRGWRLAIVTLAGVGFVIWTIHFAGTELVGEAARLRVTLTVQANRLLELGGQFGLVQGGVDVQQ
jgi:predicted PurR-regulated permease PerM